MFNNGRKGLFANQQTKYKPDITILFTKKNGPKYHMLFLYILICDIMSFRRTELFFILEMFKYTKQFKI